MPELPPVVRISTEVYRLLLKAYPKPFRSEYGEEMSDVFSSLMMDALQRQGPLGVVGTWFRVIRDFCFSVTEQRTLILRGRLTMLRSTWIRQFMAGVCTTLAVIAALAVVITASQVRRAANLRSAAPQQPSERDNLETPARLVAWDGTLDGFPGGAKFGDTEDFTFNGPDGPVTVALPVVTWEMKGADHEK